MSDLIAGNAPLHQAVREIELYKAQYLLEHKANPNIPDPEGYYPLHFCKSVHMMGLLLKSHATVHARNKHGSTPLHCAVCDRNPALVELLLEHKADPNAGDTGHDTPLHVATIQQDPENVKLLLQARANPNVTNLFLRKTPLHNAARSDCFQSTQLLLEEKAAVDSIDAGGSTALIHGVHFRSDNVVNILLDYGANIHVKRNGGFGLLHIVAEQGRLTMVHNLVVRRADVFQMDPHAQFPITWAKRKPDLNAYLSKVMWEERLFTFCQGLHPRLGRDSAIRRCWTSDLSERNLIWLIGLFLKPAE